MLLGYIHKTTKIWRIWDFQAGPYQRGAAVECSSVVFKEENAYARNAPESSDDDDEKATDGLDLNDGDYHPEPQATIEEINDEPLHDDL